MVGSEETYRRATTGMARDEAPGPVPRLRHHLPATAEPGRPLRPLLPDGPAFLEGRTDSVKKSPTPGPEHHPRSSLPRWEHATAWRCKRYNTGKGGRCLDEFIDDLVSLESILDSKLDPKTEQGTLW